LIGALFTVVRANVATHVETHGISARMERHL
jgi:hypothetical protein